MTEGGLEEAARIFQTVFEIMHLFIFPEATFLLCSDTAVNMCSTLYLHFYTDCVILGM
jgi:hypothetical protein